MIKRIKDFFSKRKSSRDLLISIKREVSSVDRNKWFRPKITEKEAVSEGIRII